MNAKDNTSPHLSSSLSGKPTNRSHHNPKNNAGFSLVELLAVVIIIGILAAVAIPAYRNYIISARANEATSMLPQIRLKAESYKLEFGQYPKAGANPSDSVYTSTLSRGELGVWDTAASTGTTAAKEWETVGFHPPTKQVYFQYTLYSGTAKSQLTGTSTCENLINPSIHYSTGNQWFTVCARGDLRGLGTTPTSPAMAVGISGDPTMQRVFVNLKIKTK